MKVRWLRTDRFMVRSQLAGTDVSISAGALLNAAFIANIAHTQVLFALPSGGSVFTSIAAGAIHVALTALHEVGHAVGRARAGLRPTRIHIGLYSYEEGVAPDRPRQDFLHSLGGPAADGAAAVVAALLYFGARGAGLGPHVRFLLGFAALRAAIGLVELFPSFPMDGAQALRAHLMGSGMDRLTATRRVVRVGVVAAVATAIIGGSSLAILGAGPGFLVAWIVATTLGAVAVHLLGRKEAESVPAARRDV